MNKRKGKKRILILFLCAALLCGFIPQGMTIASALTDNDLCEHHAEHTEECGYREGAEGSPCTHEHTEECYILEINCVHEHDETCYAAGKAEPTECTHVCSEESGCIVKELNCTHEHDESCGYVEAVQGISCTYDCPYCSAVNLDSRDEETDLVVNNLNLLGAPNETEDTMQKLLAEKGTVTLDEPYHITSDTTLSGGKIERGSDYNGYLLYVEDGVNLILKNITIDGKNITADNALIYVGEDASLMIGENAVVQNGANNIIVGNVEQSKNRIAANTAANNVTSGTDYAGGIFINGGTVILNGGKIINNNGIFGGGIGGNPGNIIIESGEVSGNFARLCGGGIFLRGTSSNINYDINVNGGQISKNIVGYGEEEKLSNPKANGAGIYVSYANMTMTSGTISENRNNNWLGGGVFIQGLSQRVEFNMTGGTVSDNFAQVGGGGIYLESGTVATIDGSSVGAVKIIGNEAKGISLYNGWYYYAGGGINVNGGSSNYTDAILNIKNVIIKENIAASDGEYTGTDTSNSGYAYGYGSGIGACSTSNIKIYITDGGAIYNNVSQSTKSDGKYNKVQLYIVKQKAGLSYDVKISKYMLGGGLYNWMNYAETVSQDLSGASRDNYIYASAVPSAEDIVKAEALATVIISGNKTASIGGGLAVNGTMIMGREAYGNLTITKTVSGSGADSEKAFTFTVTLDDTSISGTYGDMTFANGVATFTLKDGENKTALALPSGVGYTVTESDNEGYTVTVNGTDGATATGTIAADVPSNVIFNNYYPSGDLTVSKTVSGGGASSIKAFTFTVTLDDTSISGTYGDMTFVNGVASFTLKGGENKTASGLPAGVGYTVVESDNAGYTVTVNGTDAVKAEGAVVDKQTASATFNNYKAGGGGEGDTPDPAKVIITAKKTLDGVAPVGKDYNFVLKDKNGNIIQTVHNNGDNVVFNTLSFSNAGTFIYTISEVLGTDSIINYDVTVYKVVIKVTKSGDYKATVNYEKDSAAYDGIPVFANTTKQTGDDKVSVSVNKVWNDNDSESRPASVTVQLYRDGMAYGSSVVLNSANGWRYVWTDLDQSAAWTVNEVDIPSGYSVEVTHTGNAWTITNTLKSNPDTPGSSYDSATPDNPDKFDRLIDDVSQTGDTSNVSIWIVFVCLSLFGIFAGYGKKCYCRRKR
jgi:pilin isopeptide linkage protein